MSRTGAPDFAPILQASCVVAMVAFISVFGALDRPAAATIGAASCLAALVLLRFNNIGKLKALGVELESAKRDAHEAAEEAKATVAQLRALAAMTGKLELDSLALRSRLGTLPPQKLLAIRDKLCTTLRVAGCSDADVAKAQALLMASIRADIAHKITSTAWDEYTAKVAEARSPGKANEIFAEKVGQLWRREEGTFAVATPAQFRRVLGELDALSEGVARRLEDFERYERTGEVPNYDGDSDYLHLPEEA